MMLGTGAPDRQAVLCSLKPVAVVAPTSHRHLFAAILVVFGLLVLIVLVFVFRGAARSGLVRPAQKDRALEGLELELGPAGAERRLKSLGFDFLQRHREARLLPHLFQETCFVSPI